MVTIQNGNSIVIQIWNVRWTSIEWEPGHYYTITPYAKDESCQGDFCVIVYTEKDCPVEHKELVEWKSMVAVEGEWIGKTAGGSMGGGGDSQSSATWKNNP